MNDPFQTFTGTPVVGELQQQQQGGLDFLNRFKAGQIGPQGFSADQIGRIISTLGQHAVTDPSLSAALEPFLAVAEGVNAPLGLRQAALGYRAMQGATQGQINPQVAQFLSQGATSTPMLQEQGALFNYLAPTFFNNPQFQQSFGGFLGSHAPGGQVPLDVATLGAIAPTYNYLRTYAPDVASQFGPVALPTDATNLSNPLRNAIIDAAKGALGAQGFNYVTPEGPARFTPNQIFGQGLDALGNILSQGYGGLTDVFTGGGTGVPQAPASGFAANPVSAPASAGQGQAPSAQSAVQQAQAALTSGQGRANPAATSQSTQQSNLAQVQAYLQQNGIPQGVLLQALVSNEYGPAFAKLLGTEGVRELQAWAQTALPQGGQLPSGTIDPFRALFTAANGQ